MPARLLNLSDPNLPLPEFLILDASIVLELAPNPNEQPHPNHVAAVTFLHRLQGEALAERVIAVLPLLAFEECYFKICQRILRALSGNQFWHIYYKQNPDSFQQILPHLLQFFNTLRAFPIHISEPEDIATPALANATPLAQRMGELISSFQILPKDATILSEAERWQIRDVVTLDSDWSRADGFNVYTPL